MSAVVTKPENIFIRVCLRPSVDILFMSAQGDIAESESHSVRSARDQYSYKHEGLQSSGIGQFNEA